MGTAGDAPRAAVEDVSKSPYLPIVGSRRGAGREWEGRRSALLKTRCAYSTPYLPDTSGDPALGTRRWTISGKWSPRTMISHPRATLGWMLGDIAIRPGRILANRPGGGALAA
jgi:hypothetical protein